MLSENSGIPGQINSFGERRLIHEIHNALQIFRTLLQDDKNLCNSIDETYEETEELYGESNAEFEIPIEESIYNEGRLYSKIYKNEENEYNINFYRKENKIICEFVKVL